MWASLGGSELCLLPNLLERATITTHTYMLLAAGAAVLAGDGPPQLRVAKGLGTRDYGTLRISLITQHGEPHKPGSMAWDYSEQFQHRWKQFDLHSSLVEVAGASIDVPLGDGVVANVSLPHQGAGVAGVLIADPCVRRASVTGLAGCFYAGQFQTWDRTPALLNAFVGHPDTDFWGILGDNWYDRTGDTTAIIYDRLGLPTLAKPFVVRAPARPPPRVALSLPEGQREGKERTGARYSTTFRSIK